MRAPKRFIATAALAGTIGAAFIVGQQTTSAPAADASTGHTYRLRVGDRVVIPSIAQVCSVSTEGGAADLFCARHRKARHQVTIFRDRILVWKVGDPDNRPVWSGKP